MLRRAILAILFLLAPGAQGKVLIWDLGNTLFGTSYLTIARAIGIHHFIAYMFFDWRNPNIKPIVFDILDKINPSEENPREIATDDEGHPLPALMNRWLAGLIPGKEIVKSITEYCGHLDKQHYFVSERQKRLVLGTIEQMFNPTTLVDATRPIMDGITLLHDCFHARNSDGTSTNTLFVLSNWDDVSFALLKKRYAGIFTRYFDAKNLVISGAIGLVKPKKEAFAYLLDTYKLDPKECILIDDQYDNILAAQSVGITSLLMCTGNYKTLRTILTKLGALPAPPKKRE